MEIFNKYQRLKNDTSSKVILIGEHNVTNYKLFSVGDHLPSRVLFALNPDQTTELPNTI